MHIPICAEAKSGLLMRFCLATLSICLLTEQEVKHSQNTPIDGIIKSHLINQCNFFFIQFLYPSPLEGQERPLSFSLPLSSSVQEFHFERPLYNHADCMQ